MGRFGKAGASAQMFSTVWKNGDVWDEPRVNAWGPRSGGQGRGPAKNVNARGAKGAKETLAASGEGLDRVNRICRMGIGIGA